jgi:hypothetical protein
MCDEKERRASVSIRPTHGSAHVRRLASVLPGDKSDKEVFWVQTLVDKLPEFSAQDVGVRPNADDSHGNHDVMIDISDDCSIGVQVTELTSEFRRRREAIRDYIKRVISLLHEQEIGSERKVLVKLLYASSDPEEFELDKPQHLVQMIKDQQVIGSFRITDEGSHRVLFEAVGESDFYVPNVNNIGIDVDIDLTPRSWATYSKAVEYLAQKKSNSRSPWLLIWSVSFWQDRHWLGDKLIAFMRAVFLDACFERVYFVESMDGEGPFEVNLRVHTIK